MLGRFEGDLWHFHRIAQTPGFVALVAAFIEELKQARITPEQFGAFIKSEIAKWAPVVKASGARVD